MQRAQMIFPTNKNEAHNVLLKNVLKTFSTYEQAMEAAKKLHKDMKANVAYVAHAKTQNLVAIVDNGSWL